MAKFTTGARSMTKGELYESQYNSARVNLLIAVAFTVLNCVLAVFGGSTYFLFSCTFPYTMVSEGAFWTGIMLSAEEYAEMGVTQADMMPMWFLYVMLVPAVIAVGLYVLCWALSKKRVGWMIAATVLFVIDTLFLILYYGVHVDLIMDYLFHAWVLFILIRGVIAHFRLKEVKAQAAEFSGEAFVPVPEQSTEEVQMQQDGDAAQSEQSEPTKANSPALHMADFSTKNRVLLQYQVEGYDICYRRVGKVNELVVNSMVYDLLDTGVAEFPHELSCMLDGHEIKAGFGADSHSYIVFDGEVVKRKLRLV
ncbi:MAG: hypothetical protein IJW70_12290 [Clostridia bacterium]|nr:hypothetical protein [Clostridia bacterium]MBQ7380445.1 hypothetical protein [Clostridia bacterium]